MKSFFQEFEQCFGEFVGGFQAKLGILLSLVEPKTKGILIVGNSGVGKSFLLGLTKSLVKSLGIPVFEVPLGVSEENLLGGVDIEKTLALGKRVFQPGILQKAKGGVLIVDDLGLFSEYTQGLIFSRIEDFTLIATFNPKEGKLSSHFLDKFGMVAYLDRFDKEELKALLKRSAPSSIVPRIREAQLIKAAQARLKNGIEVPEEVLDFVVGLCQKYNVVSHRGEESLLFCAKGVAALLNKDRVEVDEVNLVAPLVLAHRARTKEETPSSKSTSNEDKTQKNPEKKPEEKKHQSSEKKTQPTPKRENEKDAKGDQTKDEKASSAIEVPLKMKESTFEIGTLLKIPLPKFKKDKIIRNSSGRRTKSRSVFSGKFVRSVNDKMFVDIDILGTIKVAAPYQKIRGRKEKLVVYKEDLRYKEKEKKIGHLVVFVVDGSGSMAAKQRMLATKGAIFSLLMDCYQKRERVAMILFRKFSAEVVLPPTNSVTLAYKKLKELPTGGNTPLSAGLLEAYKLIKRYHSKYPLDRVLLVILTDGKGNIPIVPKEDPQKETKNLCQALKELDFLDTVVIDAEVKDELIRFDLAKDLAKDLNASYFCLENLEPQTLLSIVKSKLAVF